MLTELTIENIAIIDQTSLVFGTGLTAITGETGAGKSLLVDSISLCIGERADSTMVRTGTSRAVVNAVFDVRNSSTSAFEESGIFPEDGVLYVQREIAIEGRSQCRINSVPVPLGVLKTVTSQLIDLHGQHEHQSLLHSERHLDFLDAFIGNEAAELRSKIALTFVRLTEIREALASLEKGEKERERMLDLLRYEVAELQSANIKVGEFQELDLEIRRQQSGEKNSEIISFALDALAIREGSAKELVSESAKRLQAAAELDNRLKPAADLVSQAADAVEEAIPTLREAQEFVDYNEALLELLAARQDELLGLKRKYGNTEEEILQYLEKAAASLDTFENASENANELRKELKNISSVLHNDCKKLTQLREKSSKLFAEQVLNQLSDLAMGSSKFSVLRSDIEPNSTGADKIEFLFSANVGESEKPLAKIASGGELSRLMLAIKSVMAGKGGISTLIFDEVDAGLGGEAAGVVAKKLEKLAENYQVIVITHSAPIASRALTQFHVQKVEIEGRTVARIANLTKGERIQEIARMLSGESSMASAQKSAEEMLSKR